MMSTSIGTTEVVRRDLRSAASGSVPVGIWPHDPSPGNQLLALVGLLKDSNTVHFIRLRDMNSTQTLCTCALLSQVLLEHR